MEAVMVVAKAALAASVADSIVAGESAESLILTETVTFLT